MTGFIEGAIGGLILLGMLYLFANKK